VCIIFDLRRDQIEFFQIEHSYFYYFCSIQNYSTRGVCERGRGFLGVNILMQIPFTYHQTHNLIVSLRFWTPNKIFATSPASQESWLRLYVKEGRDL
jgi:hypothetical protein